MSLRVQYGGTFDPVHDGHLAIARAAHRALGATIHLMPAADPPHRPPPGANARQRATMLDLAVQGEPGLDVDRRELARAGRSFTVDTLHALRRELGPDAPIALLVGADSFRGLPDWKAGLALFDLAHVVVAGREGGAVDESLPPALAHALAGRWTDDAAALNSRPAGRVFPLRQALHPASASAIRAAIARGDDRWRDRVPPAVADYIHRQGLYGAGTGHPASL